VEIWSTCYWGCWRHSHCRGGGFPCNSPVRILSAYIGGAAGVAGVEVQAGAAYAEIRDPAHDPNSPNYVGPYDGPDDLYDVFGSTPWDPSTWNLGDEAKDNPAVTLGLKLWDRYGASMTLSDFKRELANSIGGFSRCSPDLGRPDVAMDWPYTVGYFNNDGDVFVLQPGRCP
jgi:hypothetical protein